MTSRYSHDIILVLFQLIIKQDYKNKYFVTGDWSHSVCGRIRRGLSCVFGLLLSPQRVFFFFFLFFFFLCVCFFIWVLLLHSTLVISNYKGLSEILRDIRTSTYQICRIEEKINKTTTFNKYMCNWTLEGRDILKILWKIRAISPISTIFFYLLLDFHV